MVNIVLTGFMCTGKTSVGEKLSKKLNYEYVDIDELIEKHTSMKIAEIFEKYGEQFFRDIESEIVEKVSKLDKKVISTGGGVVLRDKNMRNLKENGIIINLTASPQTIYERLKNQPGIRPLLNKPNPLEEIQKLLNFREPYYQNCDIRINTDNLKIDEVVDKIIEFVKDKIDYENHNKNK